MRSELAIEAAPASAEASQMALSWSLTEEARTTSKVKSAIAGSIRQPKRMQMNRVDTPFLRQLILAILFFLLLDIFLTLKRKFFALDAI